MICPHCGKEVDGYIVTARTDGVNLNLNNGCGSGLINYTYTLNNAAAANPPTMIGQGSSVLNLTGCANQGNLNMHYHTS